MIIIKGCDNSHLGSFSGPRCGHRRKLCALSYSCLALPARCHVCGGLVPRAVSPDHAVATGGNHAPALPARCHVYGELIRVSSYRCGMMKTLCHLSVQHCRPMAGETIAARTSRMPFRGRNSHTLNDPCPSPARDCHPTCNRDDRRLVYPS